MKTTDKNYDFQGMSSQRIFINFLRWKLFPFGDIGGGPGIVWLFSIWFRHKFGKVIAGYRIRKASRK
ncbi:MAG TPA: hypothetical protein DDW55_14780 [Gammaproteobacteria bacterium]|nr:hypothetical protein [Gammaproteobacteria bacterium]